MIDPLDPTLTSPLAATLAAAAESAGPRSELPAGPSRYALGAELGAGGMGRVFTAVDRQFDREVAVKTLRDPGATHLAERLQLEALVTGLLEHPGITPVYERGTLEGSPFYAMRRVEGSTLAEALAVAGDDRDERLELVPALTRVAQTLAYAHARGVVHRDLKPSNIIVGNFGEVFVLDWGLARVRGLASAASGAGEALGPMDTQPGSAIGTPAFMSPEQASGDLSRVDERSDVFALGAILYQLLAGRPPYDASTAKATVELAREAAFAPIDETAPGAPRALRRICARAMNPEPRARFASASELAGALERFTADTIALADSGPVGWIARLTTAVGLVLAIGTALAAIAFLSSMRSLGIPGIVSVVLFGLGMTLAGVELATRGRYALHPLIIGLALATFLGGVAGATSGVDQLLTVALEPGNFGDPTAHRELLTSGARMAIGNATVGAALAMTQVFAWAVARRRALMAGR